MRFFNKVSAIFFLCGILVGCVNRAPSTASEMNYKEDILLKAKNYDGLISLYRSWLKKNDEPEARLKLSRFYYQAGDYKSSLHYLQPLYKKSDIRVYTLQAQNMIALGDYAPAIRVTNSMLNIQPQNAEAYNLKGVALALSGKLSEASAAIEQSRAMFIADDVALNNQAMIAMLDKRYQDAVGILLPQYLRGRKQEQLLHNLVFSLVKVGDIRYAKNIIQNEGLSSNPDELVDALARITATGEDVS